MKSPSAPLPRQPAIGSPAQITLEYWVKNLTQKDVLSSDLQLKIPAGRVVNLGRLNPHLTHEILQKSETSETGFLFRCFFEQKLVKLPSAPAKPQAIRSTIIESFKPIPSRVKTSIVLSPRDKDFIEELSSFDDLTGDRYSEGFSEPSMVDGESGEQFDGKPFQAVVIPAGQSEPTAEELPAGSRIRLKAKLMKQLGADVVLMDASDTDQR